MTDVGVDPPLAPALSPSEVEEAVVPRREVSGCGPPRTSDTFGDKELVLTMLLVLFSSMRSFVCVGRRFRLRDTGFLLASLASSMSVKSSTVMPLRATSVFRTSYNFPAPDESFEIRRMTANERTRLFFATSDTMLSLLAAL